MLTLSFSTLLLLAPVTVVGNLVIFRAVLDFAGAGVDNCAFGNVGALAVVLLAGKEVVESAAILEILSNVMVKVFQGVASLVESTEVTG